MTAQSDVDAVIASVAAPKAEFRSSVASWAMGGKPPTVEEMQVGVELVDGRTDLAAARARLGRLSREDRPVEGRNGVGERSCGPR